MASSLVRDDFARKVRIGLWILAIPTFVIGVWAVFAPSSWYVDFNKGLAPPSAFGAYNEHFIQDLGSGYLGVGALLIWSALRQQRDLVRGALIAYVVFSLPHFVIHLVEDGDLDRKGYLFTNGILGLGIAVALYVWAMNARTSL